MKTKVYEVITGSDKDFGHKLTQAVAQGANVVGNMTTVNTSVGSRHSILVYK